MSRAILENKAVVYVMIVLMLLIGCKAETPYDGGIPSQIWEITRDMPIPSERLTLPDTFVPAPELTSALALGPTPVLEPTLDLTSMPNVLLTPPIPVLTPVPTSTAISGSDDCNHQSASNHLPLENILIGLDPGHQLHGNNQTEPVSPGSSEMKKRVSSGTQGKWTCTPEHEVNLVVGLLLRDLLIEQGATVIMTRETGDVDISNAERAQFFNRAETDYALRLHCNGSENSDKHGAFMLVPQTNPHKEECNAAAKALIEAFCKATGAKNLGITIRSDQTGFNWCDRMIINIEMGHMTNKDEDYSLNDSVYQKKMAQGLCDGILNYFADRQQ